MGLLLPSSNPQVIFQPQTGTWIHPATHPSSHPYSFIFPNVLRPTCLPSYPSLPSTYPTTHSSFHPSNHPSTYSSDHSLIQLLHLPIHPFPSVFINLHPSIYILSSSPASHICSSVYLSIAIHPSSTNPATTQTSIHPPILSCSCLGSNDANIHLLSLLRPTLYISGREGRLSCSSREAF